MSTAGLLLSLPILERMKTVEGWLDTEEADLLIAGLSRALADLPEVHAVVEVGSYCGKATTVLGSVLRALAPGCKVHAIDPHEGVVGSADTGLIMTRPTLDTFMQTLRDADLTDVVETVQRRSYETEWDLPIRFLFIDWLHDYVNVSRDLRHFEPWLVDGAYVAFHDYADYYPGVVRFVDELLASGRYEHVGRVRSMIVLRRTRPEAPDDTGGWQAHAGSEHAENRVLDAAGPRRAPRTTRAAVVTMVRNEAEFFPIWLRYYSRFFQPEDIYILDHGSSDGSTDKGPFVRIQVDHPTVDWGWHRDQLQAQQHALLEHYDMVLCTDVDEIVAPDPRTGDLGSYLADFSDEFVNCLGYELLHLRDREPPFDRTRPVLQQRGFWFHNPAYSKPLLAQIPMQWHGGLHARTDGRTNEDPRLFLIHLHRMDYEICLARHLDRVSVPWNPRDVREGWGWQNRIVDPEAFARWFVEDSCVAGFPVTVEPVPDYWRDLF